MTKIMTSPLIYVFSATICAFTWATITHRARLLLTQTLTPSIVWWHW